MAVCDLAEISTENQGVAALRNSETSGDGQGTEGRARRPARLPIV